MNEMQNNRSDADVREGIAAAVARGAIDETQGHEIFWLHTYARDKHLSNDDVAKLINKSAATVSTIFSGKYGAADWSSIVSAIVAARRRESKRVRGIDVGFVETDTAKIIFKTCDHALNDGMPAFIYGASQLGKTYALREYVRRANSSAVKYYRCGAGATQLSFARDFAKECHLRIGRYSSDEFLKDVTRSLDSSCLVILDEFHEFLETVGRRTSKKLVEYVREIYDNSHCGLVLCTTKVGLADLEEGPDHKLFDQLRRRGIIKVVFPDIPNAKDISAFAKAYNLPPPSNEILEYVHNLLQERGLNVFLSHLNKASAIASSSGKTLDWQLFLTTSRGFESLANLKSDWPNFSRR